MTDKQLVEKYKRYLLLEKNLSGNTIDAYMSDLQMFVEFKDSRSLTFSAITYGHLQEFLSELL